ncbi:MAG: MFS transporter [Alphaproteobacteria bacterium]|nr:MFS transporter [Alphaproteobacteria bacterium]
MGETSPGAPTRGAGRVYASRALRAFCDGFTAILLPLYLFDLGFDATVVGVLSTVTLLGSAALTIAVGLYAHRYALRTMLLGAALLMAATGLAFGFVESLLPLFVVAAVGTLNPSSGDVSVFVPLEHSLLARLAPASRRTLIFAIYSAVGTGAAALGALSVGLLDHLPAGLDRRAAIQVYFLVYGAAGLIVMLLYRGLPQEAAEAHGDAPKGALNESRGHVLRLAALFSVDAFGGGFILNALLAVWLFSRFGLSPSEAGAIFFVTGLCSAVSYFIATWIAGRIGLLNTMVFTHLPASILLMLTPLAPDVGWAVAALVARSLLSQMDVPTRTSYVMATVTPAERPAASSFTNVPRSLASALAPAIGGWMLSLSPFGWPLIVGGALKLGYDLALLAMFSRVRPPEEQRP